MHCVYRYYAQDFLTFTPDIPYELVYPSGPASVQPAC